MAHRAFFSFHYNPDNQRAAQIRNMGMVEGNTPVSDNNWEKVTKGGASAIEKWIADQLSGKSCTIVLIGANTAGRKWINHEIIKSWNDGKGVVGVYIHNLKNLSGDQSLKGNNPFSSFTMKRDNKKMSSIVKAYDPPYTASTSVYDHIKNHLNDWVEEAISIRQYY